MAYKEIIYRFLALFAFCVQLLEKGYAEKIDSMGRKFVFAMPTPYKPSSVTGTYVPNFHFLVSTPSSGYINGTVNIPGVVWGQSFRAAWGHPGNITIAATDYIGYNFQETPKTVTIEAYDDVSVHAFYSYTNYNSEWLVGSTNVMPVDALGKKYFVASYAPYSARKSEFTVTAVDEDSNTVVEIETRDGLRYREVLAPSETYQLQSTSDLTGTVITADKPVSVMSGSGCSKVPVTKQRCNYLVVHLTDVKSAGFKFVISPFKDRTTGYIFRVLATVDNTQLRFGGSNNDVTFEIHAGQFYEKDVTDDTVSYIVSTEPVLVFKYGKGGDSGDTEGDPIMVIVPAVSHFVSELTFEIAYLPTRSPTRYSLSITIACPYSDGLILSGGLVGVWPDMLTGPGSYCILRIPLNPGTNTLTHKSVLASFIAEIHAISYKIGYVYQAGYNIKSKVAATGRRVNIPQGIPQYLGDDGLGLLCEPNKMTVFVNSSLLIDGEASDVHFTDLRCFGRNVMNNSIIYVMTSYAECGTLAVEGEQTSSYTNRLIYEGPRYPGPVMRDPTFNIPVSCSQNNRVLVSLAIAPQSTKVNTTLDGEEQLVNVTYAFQMFPSNQYNKAYTEDDFPVTVDLGQSLYFEASVTGVKDLKLMTQQCLATKSNDPLATPNYIFVDNGCPSDNTVVLYQTDDDAQKRFSMQTFVFLQNNEELDKAYIHCWLLACNSNDSSARCNADCSVAGRGQRDTVHQTNQDLSKYKHVYTRQGPIILTRQDRGDSSSIRSRMASAVGGSLAVIGIGLLIVLLVFLLMKVKRRRGSFSLRQATKRDDTIQLIELSPKHANPI